MVDGGALTSPRPRNSIATYEIINQTKVGICSRRRRNRVGVERTRTSS